MFRAGVENADGRRSYGEGELCAGGFDVVEEDDDGNVEEYV